jgi:hypothetical protein
MPAPMRDLQDTTVTFTFATYDTTQAQISLPISVIYLIPGYAPWASEPEPQPTPYRSSVSARKHPGAEVNVDADAHVVGPPGTVITCSWVAATPSGTRSSDRSRGGESDAAIPADGTETSVHCSYQA